MSAQVEEVDVTGSVSGDVAQAGITADACPRFFGDSDAGLLTFGASMTRTPPLHEALLELGLEDWIPLPEILATPEVRSIIDGDQATETVSLALVDLLRQGRIQVWAGHWPDEPTPVGDDLAESMLLDRQRFSFGAEASGHERVFFVNVENLAAQIFFAGGP